MGRPLGPTAALSASSKALREKLRRTKQCSNRDHRNETEDFMEYKVTLRGKPPKIVAIPVKVIRLGTLPLGMSEFDYRLMLLREYCNKSGTPFYGEFPIDWELK
jgi:hypothetical protein